MPFEEARDFIRKLKLKNNKEYGDYIRNNNINIPLKPYKTYKNKGWIDIGDFLGTFKKSNVGREYKSFEDAKIFLKKLNFKSRTEWYKYYKEGNKPDDMPVILSKIYGKHPKWKGLSDFLGSDYIRTNDRNYLTYKEAEDYVRKIGLKNVREWQVFSKSERPINIPSNPKGHYENKGWENYGVFLGNGNKKNKLNAEVFFSFEEAKDFLKKIKLKNTKEWNLYKSSEEFNIKIPRSPMVVYKNKGWIGFGDFLGNE